MRQDADDGAAAALEAGAANDAGGDGVEIHQLADGDGLHARDRGRYPGEP